MIRLLRQDFKDTIISGHLLLPSKQQTEAASMVNLQKKEQQQHATWRRTLTHDSNLVLLLRVQRMLLPLLLKDEVLHKTCWASDVVWTTRQQLVGAALHSIVTELRQHLDDLSSFGNS
jgi:hypothetical protein